MLDLSEVNAFPVRLPSAAIALLQRNPNVEAVEAVPIRYAMGSRSPVPSFGKSATIGEQAPYGISMVQADQLSYNAAGKRKLCVVDSGFDLTHEDLQHTLVTGENLTTSGDWSTDEARHGTHVGGTIAALANNGVGVVGVVSNRQLALQIEKVFDASGSAPSSTILKAALNCMRARANVISMSLGGPQKTKFEERTYQRIADRHILVIAAAGNAGTSAISYPAGYASVMSVAAIDASMNGASFSQFDSDVEIAAPGVDVFSTVPMGTGRKASTSDGSVSYAVQPMEGTPPLNVT